MTETPAILTAPEVHPPGGHGHHDPDVPHQFDDMEQKNISDTLGMWTFLATEVLFFGALFAGLMLYRSMYTKDFIEASNHLIQWIGAVNTAVLLCSSFTVVLAVHAAKHGDNKALTKWLLATMGLGAMFLGIKAYEYSADFKEHLKPSNPEFGLSEDAAKSLREAEARGDLVTKPELWSQALHDSKWDVPTDRRHIGDARLTIRHAQLFYVFYYTMTAIHALHMVIGLAIFGLLAYRAHHGYYTPAAAPRSR